MLLTPGWREHGLIKGKADFSSCRSCTDRRKTQKSLRHKPVSVGNPRALRNSDTGGWDGESQPKIQKTFQTPDSHAEMGLCGWDSGTAGREMVNLVSLSRVQESVTVQALECCSCLGAQLKIHKLGGLKRSTEGFGLYSPPLGWELHSLELSKKISLRIATENSNVASAGARGSQSYPVKGTKL